MKLFLHADDVAGTESGTVRILDAWQSGCLDGFSVFANGEAVEDTRVRLSNRPQDPARIVAHLNLSEGPSVAGAARVPLLVDHKGELKHTFGSLLATWLLGSAASRQALVDQVEAEWRAQTLRIIKLIAPRRLTGIDGHIHVHMLPFLFPIAAKLANEYGIGTIRIVQEPYHFSGSVRDIFTGSYVLGVAKHCILRACSMPARKIARERGLQFPSHVIGVLYSGRMTKAAALAGISAAERKGGEFAEVMFHVGRSTNDEKSRWGNRDAISAFNCSPQRDRELAELTALHTTLVDRGLRLSKSVAPDLL